MLNRKGKRASRPPSLARFKRLTRYDGDPLKQAHAFTFFVHLPGELQEHILSFLPVRVLARDVLPVDRRCKQLVDALIQRRLGLYLSAEGAQTGRGGEGKGFVVRGRGERQSRREKSALIFEAQRPIDTLTTRHALHFSHFAYLNGERHQAIQSNVSTAQPLQAEFSFDSPGHVNKTPGSLKGARHGETEGTGLELMGRGEERVRSSEERDARRARGTDPRMNNDLLSPSQVGFPGVHVNDVHRLRDVHVSSSVSTSDRVSLADRATRRTQPATTPSSSRDLRLSNLDIAPSDLDSTSSLPPRRLDDQAEGSQTEGASHQTASPQRPDPTAITHNGLRTSAQYASTGASTTVRSPSRRTVPASTHAAQDRIRTGASVSGLWSEPITSSMAALDGYLSTSSDEGSRERSTAILEEMHRRVRAARNFGAPTYRFQLDALDSFETWILSLTVQRHWWPDTVGGNAGNGDALPDSSPYPNDLIRQPFQVRRSGDVGVIQKTASNPLASRPMRWEKRVVEGLDRVFRDWFRPVKTCEGSAGAGCSLDEAMGSVRLGMTGRNGPSLSFGMGGSTAEGDNNYHLGSSMPVRSMFHPSAEETEVDPELTGDTHFARSKAEPALPNERQLELDGQGCTLQIQPHANELADAHPALASMSSHYYLSSPSSPYISGTAAMPRAEFTFHCTTLSINAARLLSVFEDIEADMQRTQDVLAQQTSQRPRSHATTLPTGQADAGNIIAGSAPSGVRWTDARHDASYVSTAPRGRQQTANAAAAVVMFGAVRD